jgi:hypothetical protein
VDNPELELAEDIGRFTVDPLSFVRYAYPWREPNSELAEYDGARKWQREVLETIGTHLRGPDRFTPLLYAIASGHGVGKSALIAMITDWAMSTCEDCRVVMTANTEPQLRTKTWPEVSKWTHLAINSHWWSVTATTVSVREKAHERLWRTDAIAWSENNTEAFAGLHNKGKRIVVIFDEGSAIADKVWEVTEGALTDEQTEIIWLAFGNPTRNTGRFRECFGKYKHRWITKQIDSRTVEGSNKEQIAKWVADYGEDSDFCRVRVRGEFPRAGATQFIGGDIVSGARSRTVAPSGFKVLAVDVARFGDDQTVLGMRQGGHLRILARLRGLDTMQVAARVMEVMRNEQPRATIIDGDGLGAGVVDCVRHTMREWFPAHPLHRLQEFHGGSSPNDSSMFFNRRAEVWGMMREWLKEGDIPDEPEIETDLTGPEYYFSSKNQIQLERKEDMKRRGLSSPDVGDMLAMSFAAAPAALEYDEMATEAEAAIFAHADKRYQEARQ